MPKAVDSQGEGLGDTVFVHHQNFSNTRLYVQLSTCSIVVCCGDKHDGYKDDRLAVCCSAAAVAQSLGEDAKPGVEQMAVTNRTQDTSEQMTKTGAYYTYVALKFKKASCRVVTRGQAPRERRAVTTYAHHITLAYLPFVPQRTRNEIWNILTMVLSDWSSSPVNVRPIRLLSSRGFEVLGPKCDANSDYMVDESDKWPDTEDFTLRRSNFLEESLPEIFDHIDGDRFRFIREPWSITQWKKANGSDEVPPELLKKVCERYHHRDHDRLQEALRIEAKCQPKRAAEDSVEILVKDTRVSDCSQIRSLLHYLREMLVYKFGVHHMEPRADVRVCTEESWHVTPQTIGLWAMRQGGVVPDRAEYVECQWLT